MIINNLFTYWFGGVPQDNLIPLGAVDAIVLSLRCFARWVLPIGGFLLLQGYYMERNDKMKTLACYRYGTASSWWRSWFWKGVASLIQKEGFLLLVVLVFDLAMGRASALFMEECVRIGILWLFHIVSLNALFLLFDLGPAKRFVPAALLLLESVTFMLGFQIKEISNMMYGTWGMYLRSSWRETDGFRAEMVLAVELFLLTASYYAGKLYLKKRDV